jgi:UDP-N-acetylmuramoylalanine--D-glutamate ligase
VSTTASADPAAPIDLDRLSLDSFAGRPVAVLGLARSGVALARFLADRGALVTVYDGSPAETLAARVEQLGGRQVTLHLGPDVDPTAVLAGQSLITTSPSISSRFPTTESRLRAALSAIEAEGRVPVVSEIDLFLRLCPATTIGVTGTKGKTTTSSLAAAILATGPDPALLGGNIGTPLVERLPELTPRHRVVLEISELQLPTLSRGTDLAVYTHVTSDHLDRHGSVEAYRAVKQRLAELLPAEGRLVINAEDPISSAYGALTRAPAVRYLRGNPPAGGVGVVDGWVVAAEVTRLAQAGGGVAMTGPGGRILSLNDIRLPGAHNTSNILAAVAVGLLFGIAPDAIRRAVIDFGGVEHRLEIVGVFGGIRYVNDSQGTQPDAVIAALRSFPPPIVLIAGGRTKGVPLDDLAIEVAKRTVAVVLIGESAPEMERSFKAAGAMQVVRADSMQAAIQTASRLAKAAPAGRVASAKSDAGTINTVLLSPAATSFDMFTDYEERGRAFKDAVHSLADRADR